MSEPSLDRAALDAIVRNALAEDFGEAGDITSKRIVRIDQPARGRILAKQEGYLAGVPVAEAVFHAVDKAVAIDWKISDGGRLQSGETVAEISGRARAILAAERTALNFLQQLSGVATMARRFVDICQPHGVAVLCTRKTVPGLRMLQRYALGLAGAQLHRAGLFDEILIKTNHVRLAAGITSALTRTKANPNLKAEVEVTSMEELEEAMEAGADKLLLDNPTPELILKAVERTRGEVYLEVSGGITLDNVDEIAEAGPDAVSIGSITHSAPAIDLSLEILGPAGAAPLPD